MSDPTRGGRSNIGRGGEGKGMGREKTSQNVVERRKQSKMVGEIKLYAKEWENMVTGRWGRISEVMVPKKRPN